MSNDNVIIAPSDDTLHDLIRQNEVSAEGIRLSIVEDNAEVARAYLYFFRNDLHEQPVGFMEDVFVDAHCRGKGYGSMLVQRIIAEAEKHGCYKLVATSRHSRDAVHTLYERLGFRNHGLEFRIDF